ncbi:BTB/POZ domain-containing protein At5g48130-like isoform X1 [Cucurbita maxima]|uniref:BTB/POZ domain-containing protein At5g48130-like isoform X1 n=2 Tax=Cucurbita maxima TaxID=3661 RepID=A0A6J1JJS2_CUCMA|nr:BTB/POZ domain-containing protein At5g48130-like isoform X1 [Cucurbita maxima]XP_022989331.1 BTB/POZ domain-containing protein At5g48130-like isoform X1 [Cucurbita maxima]
MAIRRRNITRYRNLLQFKEFLTRSALRNFHKFWFEGLLGTMLMAVISPKVSSVASSPFTSPNIGVLLKIKIISWSQETGLPVSIRIRVGDRTFNLHKHPLLSKSGYFQKRLNESTEYELPSDFPGGPETFELLALFIYGSSTLVDPFNVAALRCAAEFLEMTDDYYSGNLCERFDIYLNQVVFQSWDDTLIVLQKCQQLLPWSEELLIVSRCIESLAFMACMEILDPEKRRDQPIITMDALASQVWSCEIVKEILCQDLWIKDLIALPFEFFQRVVGSLRRQGMKEKYVSPIIVFYANKWILSQKTRQFWESTDEKVVDDEANEKVIFILQGLLDLLPMGQRTSRVVPVGFYFALLSKSLEIGLKSNSLQKLQDQIASVLHFAQVEDFLLPKTGADSVSSSIELATMEKILESFVSSNMKMNHNHSGSNSLVAELWDEYLTFIAPDPKLGKKRFVELIEKVPASWRENHNHLYWAVNTFLQAQSQLSQEEKWAICKYLNCQKLSQAACIEAVQNELMPLRLIVQALFVQQLNTQQAFKECSSSFRFAPYGEFSGSLSSSRFLNSNSQNLRDSPYTDGADPSRKTLSFLLQKDHVMQAHESSRKEYESTSFRIQNLEQELVSLKKSVQWQTISKKTDTMSSSKAEGRTKPADVESRYSSKKRNTHEQVTGCIGSVNFSAQRNYASRLFKIFSGIRLFGGQKQKRKSGFPVLWRRSIYQINHRLDL